MRKRRPRPNACCINIVCCLLTGFTLLAQSSNAQEADPAPSETNKTNLEQLADEMVAGRFEQAATGFQQMVADRGQPEHVRLLAQFGLAKVAEQQGDWQAALDIWQAIAQDQQRCSAQRALARERVAAVERRKQGLASYDPDMHRVSLPSLPAASVEFYVATDGDDVSGDGSAEHPFQSLQAARDAIRKWKQSSQVTDREGSIQVVIQDGSYPVVAPLQLTKDDSGTAASPVVYRAATMSGAVFEGGKQIPNWKPVTDVEARQRLKADVRDRVLQADLKELGIQDFGDATTLRRCPELFCNGTPQTLARWPNQGFVKTGEILGDDTFKVWNSIQGCRDGKFRFVEDQPLNWLDEPDVRLYGYWFWDWFDQFQKVESIDPEARSFTLARPYSNYGYRKDQRYFALNILHELDRPGEWYLDRQNGVIYWLPPEDTDVSASEVVLSVFESPFVTMKDTEHVILLGLAFEEGRGDGIHIHGGVENLLAGCTIRRVGGDAVVVDGGFRHGIFGCAFYSLGCAGAVVNGGDRSTLARGEHFVENCAVNDISRLKRTYTPAVRLDGCGNRVAHNLFQRIPSSAMRIEGNDQLIELNIVRDVVQESDDQGGLDMFGNPLYRGVVIRWNLWSDIVGGTHCGAAGVRLDDMISGVLVHGNIFRHCGAKLFGGVQLHGGKENLIDGNLFLDCFAGVSCSRWGEKRWLDSIAKFEQQASQPPYSNRYPSLAQLKSDADVNVICRNVFSRCQSMMLRDGGVSRTALNEVTEDAVRIDSLNDEQSLREHPVFRRTLFDFIPAGDIGPYDHPWRVTSE